MTVSKNFPNQLGTKKSLALLLLICLLLSVLVVIAVNRPGVKNIDPRNSLVTDKRSQTLGQIKQDFAVIENTSLFSKGGEAVLDRCTKGFSELRASADYKVTCSLIITHYYGFNGDFRSTMLTLGDGLAAQHWKPYYNKTNTLAGMIENYYDRYYATRHTTDIGERFNGKYLISDLPGTTYIQENSKTTLKVKYGEKEVKDFDWLKVSVGNKGVYYKNDVAPDAEQIHKTLTSQYAYVLVATVERAYAYEGKRPH
ncbi:MAG TPA: hypothetical protein VF733_03935 [Candidatus Saccharimonadales bacterium]